jgi:LuxR family transcriptional regulator, maltose regulon positive regulatory protein
MTVETARSPALLGTGQQCLARGDWTGARAAFEAALAAEDTAEGREGLGMAAWWQDDVATLFDARERAYRLYRARKDRRGAGRVAISIAVDSYYFRRAAAVARGWLRTARRLLEGLAALPEHAWLRVWEAELALALGGDIVEVRTLAAEARSIARALDDADAEMTALSLEGLALVHQGKIDEGMACLDEATTAAVAGDIANPVAVGVSCCHLISACELIRDFGRSAEWCDRVREYGERLRFDVLLAACRTLYANVLVWKGEWALAGEHLEAAIAHFRRARPAMQEEGLLRLAELRRRQGRVDEARALLAEVELHPQRGLVEAALELDAGGAARAAELARRFLRAASPENKADRVTACELLVRAQLRLGESPTDETVDELGALAAAARTRPLRATAMAAAGMVAAARGDHQGACRALEDGIDCLAGPGGGYERACLRMELARSLAVLRRPAEAERELDRAARAFEELGALGHARAAAALRAALTAGPGDQPSSNDSLSAREREVLRLLAEGLSNQVIARRLGVSAFTIKRHVANILTKLDLPTRAAAAAHAARTGIS